MNTPDRSVPEADALSIAELEARFDMQPLHLPAHGLEHGRAFRPPGR
jgi:hypothetical protein